MSTRPAPTAPKVGTKDLRAGDVVFCYRDEWTVVRIDLTTPRYRVYLERVSDGYEMAPGATGATRWVRR